MTNSDRLVERVGARLQLWWMTQKHQPMSQNDGCDLARAAIEAYEQARAALSGSPEG